MTSSIRTCLWFRDGRGREAARILLLSDSGEPDRARLHDRQWRDGHVMAHQLQPRRRAVPDPRRRPYFTLTEAVSISVETADQTETDQLWTALTANGGQESHCGWLKDRFGVSWQVFPKRLTELTLNADKNVATKAMAAMMKQMKIDIAAIEEAVRG